MSESSKISRALLRKNAFVNNMLRIRSARSFSYLRSCARAISTSLNNTQEIATPRTMSGMVEDKVDASSTLFSLTDDKREMVDEVRCKRTQRYCGITDARTVGSPMLFCSPHEFAVGRLLLQYNSMSQSLCNCASV